MSRRFDMRSIHVRHSKTNETEVRQGHFPVYRGEIKDCAGVATAERIVLGK